MLVRLCTTTPFFFVFTTPPSRIISFRLQLSKYLYGYGIQIDFLSNSPISLLWIFTRLQENTFAGSDWFMAVQRAIALACLLCKRIDSGAWGDNYEVLIWIYSIGWESKWKLSDFAWAALSPFAPQKWFDFTVSRDCCLWSHNTARISENSQFSGICSVEAHKQLFPQYSSRNIYFNILQTLK